MQIAMSVVPFERVAHRRKIKTRTLKPEGCGTPVSPSMKYGSGMLIQCARNEQKTFATPPACTRLPTGRSLQSMIMRDATQSGGLIATTLILTSFLVCGCQRDFHGRAAPTLASVCELRDKPAAFVAKNVQTSGWIYTDLETFSLEDLSRDCAVALDYSEMPLVQQSESTTRQFEARLKAAKHGTFDTNGQVFAVVQGELATYGKWKDKLHPGTLLIRKFVCSADVSRDKSTQSEALSRCEKARAD